MLSVRSLLQSPIPAGSAVRVQHLFSVSCWEAAEAPSNACRQLLQVAAVSDVQLLQKMQLPKACRQAAQAAAAADAQVLQLLQSTNARRQRTQAPTAPNLIY